jgi:hypothetical protein
MRDKEPKVEEVQVSHTRALYSGRAVPQKASLPPSAHLLFCHGDSENIALISRIPMPIPKVTVTFSISSNLVKSKKKGNHLRYIHETEGQWVIP